MLFSFSVLARDFFILSGRLQGKFIYHDWNFLTFNCYYFWSHQEEYIYIVLVNLLAAHSHTGQAN